MNLINLVEIGKKLSATSKDHIRAAIEALTALLKTADADTDTSDAAEALRTLKEAEMSFDDVKALLRRAITDLAAPTVPGSSVWVYVRDVFSDWFVYEVEQSGTIGGKMYKRSYAVVDGNVTLGEPQEVVPVTTYEPVNTSPDSGVIESTSLEIISDLVPLEEAKAIDKDGIAKVKIISPGTGSSGYYPAEVLQRDAAKFAEVQCYWDHPTTTEEADRPERSLRDLAGKVIGTPTWNPNGPTGPGVYADVQVFKPYQESVAELAPHIGMSIRALGKAKVGEVNGQKTRVIDSIETVKSVDFVTLPGRGGEILQLFEAARGGHAINKQEVAQVNEQEAQALREAQAKQEAKIQALEAENASLKRTALLSEAKEFALSVLAPLRLSDVTQKWLLETLASDPPTREGALDRDALKTKLDTATAALKESVTPAGGQIRGMGTSATSSEADKASLIAAFRESFRREGKSAEDAQRLAEIAAGY